jgi:SAM-dependent methyltransferase
MTDIHEWLKNGKHFSRSLKNLSTWIKKKNINSLLDIGCGNGELLRRVKNNIPNLAGCDVRKSHVEIAIKNSGIDKIVKCDLYENCPFNERFEAVVAINWLHDPKNSLSGKQTNEEILKLADNIEKCVCSEGIFIHDWRTYHSKINLIGEVLISKGWKKTESIKTVGFPIFVFKRI